MAANVIKPLGLITVTTATTLVQIKATSEKCHGIFVQAKPTNTGYIYIFHGNTGTAANFIDMVGWLGIPSGAAAPFFQVGISNAQNPLDISDYYLDASVNGEGAIVTLLVS
jgi:hypothetical protein